MLNKNAASMIIGKSMDQEICLILGQVSLSLLCWKRNVQTDGQGDGVPKACPKQAAADS